MIIGLSGFAQSGKSTAGEMLERLLGYELRAFADPMRNSLYKLNPYVQNDGTRLQEVVDDKGWEWAKKHTDTRRLLQVYGTQIGREMFGETFWVEQGLKGLSTTSNVVFTDVRFPNEAYAIEGMGGVVWRISRPGVTALNDHASEHALDDYTFDTTIKNNGTLADLADQVIGKLQKAVRGL